MTCGASPDGADKVRRRPGQAGGRGAAPWRWNGG
jgi:hypothetical protein